MCTHHSRPIVSYVNVFYFPSERSCSTRFPTGFPKYGRVAFTASPSLPIFSSFSDVVSPDNPAIAAPTISVVHASSTLQGGGSKTSPEFLRTKFALCAFAYVRRSPSQSIMPPSHFIRIASSLESMYSFTLGSIISKSIAWAAGGSAVVNKTVATREDATKTRARHHEKALFVSTADVTTVCALARGTTTPRGEFFCVKRDEKALFVSTADTDVTTVCAPVRGTTTPRGEVFFVKAPVRPANGTAGKLETSACVAIASQHVTPCEGGMISKCQVITKKILRCHDCTKMCSRAIRACSPRAPTMASGPPNPAALSEPQSDSEMFDVMHAPIDGFDIFTDKGTPTGEQKQRGLVHRDRDWHRSVHVWLVDSAKQHVLLQKRSSSKDTFPDRWDISAAGHVEAGMGSRATAVRELAEELGVVCEPNELAFHFTVPAEQAAMGGCNCFEDVYFLQRDSATTQLVIGEQEVTETKWIAMNTLLEKLRVGDETVVPRTTTYVDAFAAALSEKYGYGKETGS